MNYFKKMNYFLAFAVVFVVFIISYIVYTIYDNFYYIAACIVVIAIAYFIYTYFAKKKEKENRIKKEKEEKANRLRQAEIEKHDKAYKANITETNLHKMPLKCPLIMYSVIGFKDANLEIPHLAFRDNIVKFYENYNSFNETHDLFLKTNMSKATLEALKKKDPVLTHLDAEIKKLNGEIENLTIDFMSKYSGLKTLLVSLEKEQTLFLILFESVMSQERFKSFENNSPLQIPREYMRLLGLMINTDTGMFSGNFYDKILISGKTEKETKEELAQIELKKKEELVQIKLKKKKELLQLYKEEELKEYSFDGHMNHYYSSIQNEKYSELMRMLYQLNSSGEKLLVAISSFEKCEISDKDSLYKNISDIYHDTDVKSKTFKLNFDIFKSTLNVESASNIENIKVFETYQRIIMSATQEYDKVSLDSNINALKVA